MVEFLSILHHYSGTLLRRGGILVGLALALGLLYNNSSPNKLPLTLGEAKSVVSEAPGARVDRVLEVPIAISNETTEVTLVRRSNAGGS